MQTRAFVPWRDIGQMMSRFNLENSENIHGCIVTVADDSRNGRAVTPDSSVLHRNQLNFYTPTQANLPVLLNH